MARASQQQATLAASAAAQQRALRPFLRKQGWQLDRTLPRAWRPLTAEPAGETWRSDADRPSGDALSLAGSGGLACGDHERFRPSTPSEMRGGCCAKIASEINY